MKRPRLTAQPVAEGVQKNTDPEVILWRDYLWNNGRTTRMWFVDPEDIEEAAIEIRPLDGAKQNPDGG